MSKLVYLGHSAFLIESSNYKLVTDPYQNGSVPNMTFPKIEEVDAVFCSHEHADHNARELVKIKNNPSPVKAVSVKVPHDKENGAKRGMNMINMFDVDGYKVVHLGDTGCCLDEETLAPFANCDVLLAPINGFFTIGPNELKLIAKTIKPRILIPMHYFMEKYQSGYPDGYMIDTFLKEFPDFEYIENVELDLDQYKNYHGVLIFHKYLQ